MPAVAAATRGSFMESTGEDVDSFIWDVKIHMLMPGQYPCIPNWHYDFVPRVNNVKDFDAVQADYPMYMWLSGSPLTIFRNEEGEENAVIPKTWVRFTQTDEHRGQVSREYTWRAFIRATHKAIAPVRALDHSPKRQHTQVYLDASNFQW